MNSKPKLVLVGLLERYTFTHRLHVLKARVQILCPSLQTTFLGKPLCTSRIDAVWNLQTRTRTHLFFPKKGVQDPSGKRATLPSLLRHRLLVMRAHSRALTSVCSGAFKKLAVKHEDKL